MVRIKGKRTDVDVDAKGIAQDSRKSAGIMSRLFTKFSAMGLVGAIILTIASAILLSMGLVPCIVTLVIGIILIVAALFSYVTFDTISREL